MSMLRRIADLPGVTIHVELRLRAHRAPGRRVLRRFPGHNRPGLIEAQLKNHLTKHTRVFQNRRAKGDPMRVFPFQGIPFGLQSFLFCI